MGVSVKVGAMSLNLTIPAFQECGTHIQDLLNDAHLPPPPSGHLPREYIRGKRRGLSRQKLIAQFSSFPGFPHERPGSSKSSALDPGPSPGTAGA